MVNLKDDPGLARPSVVNLKLYVFGMIRKLLESMTLFPVNESSKTTLASKFPYCPAGNCKSFLMSSSNVAVPELIVTVFCKTFGPLLLIETVAGPEASPPEVYDTSTVIGTFPNLYGIKS